MAGITYFTARQSFLNERQTADQRQAFANASLIQSSLRSSDPRSIQLLESADTLPGSLSVLHSGGQWYATSISVGQSAIPAQERALVLVGTPASQLFSIGGTPQLVIGVPLPAVNADLLRGVLPRGAGRHPAHPGLRPGGRRPGHHAGRGRPRSLGQRPGAPPAGRGDRRGGGHRRRRSSTPGSTPATTPTSRSWPRPSTG